MRSHHIKVWIKVSKISLFSWKQIFIRSYKCCQWFLSGRDRLASFSFWDQCLPNTQDPTQDRHIACCCHTLSGSACLGQILCLSLFLMTWTVLRSPGWVFYKVSPIRRLSGAFLILTQGRWFSGRKMARVDCHSSHHVAGVWHQHSLPSFMLHLPSWLRLYLSGFSTIKSLFLLPFHTVLIRKRSLCAALT